MRRIFAMLSLLLLAGCVNDGPASGLPGNNFLDNGKPLSGKYAGADAGYLITAVAARSDTSYDYYMLRYRTKDRSDSAGIWWGQENIYDRRKLDIDDGKETGIVDVRRLPPGAYEIFNFEIMLNGGMMHTKWFSKQNFSVPFTIEPGKATYIGEFMAVRLTGKSWVGLSEPNGAYFVLSDKAERDVVIAKQKESGLSEVTSAVVDPNTLGNPLISATVR
jgi:hypothetical protein